jgi:hypothetical protein
LIPQLFTSRDVRSSGLILFWNRPESRGVNHPDKTNKPAAPRWIVAQLKQDDNWWLSETSDDVYWPEGGLGILDGRQLQHLAQALEQCRGHGVSMRDLLAAFHFYALQSEVADDRVRLVLVAGEVDLMDDALFAMPVVGDDDPAGYGEFLEKLTRARIGFLNASHDYARECSELDMMEELDLMDRDRFFGAVAQHPFDEMAEILSWSPAEWDEA